MNIMDKIEHSMRYVYAHFLTEDEDLMMMLQSREMHIVRARHALRERIYSRMAVTLHQVADAEGKISGHTPDHTTIINSVHRVKRGDVDPDAVEQIDMLLDEFEDYWVGLGSTVLKYRIKAFNKYPSHVLASVLAISIEYGYADGNKIKGLLREFKTTSKQLIEKLTKS